MNKRLLLCSAITLLSATIAQAQTTPSTEEMWAIIQKQQQQIAELTAQVNASNTRIQETVVQISATADAVEAIHVSGSSSSPMSQWAQKTTLGGYGEHHYNHFKDSDDKIDAHRYVLFVGHQFSENLKLFSELEVEHGFIGDTADGSAPGEVELEQAFIQWDFSKNHSLVLGQYLVPVGIMNETHEPDTFYGTERNLVEKNIIPATWWETGAMLQGEILPGFSYNAAIHSGLKADDGGKVRGGRQKSAKATAEDLAYTLRLKYTAIQGLELAATMQYQSDITQGVAADSSSATLFEAHAAYQNGPFGLKALWASWDIDGDGFDANGRDSQDGWYIEPSFKPLENLGLFVRYSEYNNNAGISSANDTEIVDYGINFWIHPRVVLKADYSDTKDSSNDSFNLGLGWSF